MVESKVNEVKELIKDKAGIILSNLLSQGGEYGEIFYERSRTTRMELEDRKLGKISHGYDEGVGLRLIKNGRTYYGYTTEPTFESLMELARTLARGEGYGPVAIGLRYIEGWTPTIIDPDSTDLHYRAEILKRAEDKAKVQHNIPEKRQHDLLSEQLC